MCSQHIVSGAVQLGTAAYLSSGQLFTWFGIRTIVPYTCATIMHRYVASTASYKKHRAAFVLPFEVFYTAFCIHGLPSWVLSDVTDGKVGGRFVPLYTT